MNLYVIRNYYSSACTIGDLVVNHKILCHTLEDVVRAPDAPKVFGQTAIPMGRYKVVVTLSPHFNRVAPNLLNVPNFDGIRMHGGNTAADTEGCLLCAYNIVNNTMIQGTAEAAITELLKDNPGDHWIEIVNTYPYKGI